jgi:amidase
MKIIKYLLIAIIIFSCEENNLTKWVNYDESSELIKSQENENRRLRYQRIQSISKDKNQLIDGFEKEISKFIKNKYESYKELILERSIPEIQKNVIEGKLSYYDLTLFYLSRIYLIEFNDKLYLNSIISINKDVLKVAKERDKNSKGEINSIYGIPILLKDNIGFDKLPTTAGAYSLRDNLTENAFIVNRLEHEGAIILGKTNLSEWANYFCLGCPNGYSAMGGQTLNPYGRKVLDTGGSSSGSGVATTSNLSSVSLGSETSGSILSPSSANSLVGMKPTVGHVSRSGIVPISTTLDTPGPMTKYVIDNIIVYNSIIGFDDNDSYSKNTSSIDLEKVFNSSLENKKLGYYSNYYKNDSIYKLNVDLLKSNGAELFELNPKSVELNNFRKLLDEDMRRDLVSYLEDYGNIKLEVKDVASIIEFNSLDSIERSPYGQGIFRGILNNPFSDEELYDLRESLLSSGNLYYDQSFEKYELDAVLSINNYGAGYAAAAHNPCLTVPMGFRKNNQPAGLTFIGKSGKEQILYELGYSFEKISKKRKAPNN